MRVLHAIRSVDLSLGGPVEGVSKLGIEAEKSGHHAEVASLDLPDAPYLASFPLTVYPLGTSLGKYGYSKKLIPWLKQNARKYDLVVVNGLWQYQSLGVWRALRSSGAPYVVFTHGMLDPWFKKTYPLKHLKKWLYWPWAEYRVLRDAKAVLFTCEEERILARKSFWLYEAHEIVISYGTANPSGNPKIQTAEFLTRFPHLRGKRIALFLGRIHPKKGCDLAIRAFAATLAKDRDWRLVIAGPDQVGWQPELQLLASQLGISDLVTWPGMTKGDLKWGAYRAAEFLFLPSHQENFGIVVAESLACGTPVLISNKVNIWREIENDQAGLVANDDFAGSCSLLQEWASLTEHAKVKMQAAAKRSFATRFDIELVCRNLYGTFADIAHGADSLALPLPAATQLRNRF